MKDHTREWDQKLEDMRPVAPYEKDVDKALRRVFNRGSDSLEAMPKKWLRTVADVLRDYHRQPESKFLGGGWNEEGILRRRHVFAATIEDIGKETDGWEEDEARTEDQDTVLTYPSSLLDRDRMIERIKSVGKRELMREARIAMRTIDAVWEEREVADDDLKRMAEAGERIVGRQKARDADAARAVEWLKAKRDNMGLVALAKMLGFDPANLTKVIEGKRKLPRTVFSKIDLFVRT